jgi:SPW repeat
MPTFRVKQSNRRRNLKWDGAANPRSTSTLGRSDFSFLCHRGFLRTPTKWRALTFGPAALAITAMSIAAILAFSDWEEWFNLLLGLWSMLSPWALGFMHTRAMHVSIGLGAMVMFVAALELWLVNYEPQYSSG